MDQSDMMKNLRKAFDEKDVRWRVLQSGTANGRVWAKVTPYVDKFAVYDRLDEVFGLDGWQDTYKEHARGIICELRVRVGDGWIVKSGAANYGNSKGDEIKAASTVALKFAALKLGIGRYFVERKGVLWAKVYDDEKKGAFRGEVNDGGRKLTFSYDPPAGWKNKAPRRKRPIDAKEAEAVIAGPPTPERSPGPERGDAPTKEDIKAVAGEIFKLLADPVFTRKDREVAATVVESINNVHNMGQYLKQWRADYKKRKAEAGEVAVC